MCFAHFHNSDKIESLSFFVFSFFFLFHVLCVVMPSDILIFNSASLFLSLSVCLSLSLAHALSHTLSLSLSLSLTHTLSHTFYPHRQHKVHVSMSHPLTSTMCQVGRIGTYLQRSVRHSYSHRPRPRQRKRKRKAAKLIN